MRSSVIGVMFFFLGMILVGFPGIWAFFYSRQSTRATCELRDPVVRWTDACPVPVLVVCFWSAISVPTSLASAFDSVVPFFGIFLSGIPATIYWLVQAVIWAFVARSLYRLERRGWWASFLTNCAASASYLLTFARHDIAEMWRLKGYSEAHIEHLHASHFFGDQTSWVLIGISLLWLAYTLFIERYVRRKTS